MYNLAYSARYENFWDELFPLTKIIAPWAITLRDKIIFAREVKQNERIYITIQDKFHFPI